MFVGCAKGRISVTFWDNSKASLILSYLINNDRSRSFRPDSIGFKKTFGITAASRQQGVMALCDAATETAVEGRAVAVGVGGV